MDFVELLSGTVLQGLIYALVSFGVYITYSILDFPDLGVDGTFPLGAAVTAVLLTQGVNAWATLPIALVVGALAGLITGFVHVRLRVRNLLAGIITMTALYSVNLLLAGSNLTVDRATDTIFTSPLATGLLGDMTLTGRKLVVSLVLVIVVKLVLDAYFSQKELPTALIVGDRLLAHKVCRSLSEHGICVPGELSVFCIDDPDRPELLNPPLSRFRIDVPGFCRTGMLTLLQQINHEPEFRSDERNYEFVEAGSCAPPPQR